MIHNMKMYLAHIQIPGGGPPVAPDPVIGGGSRSDLHLKQIITARSSVFAAVNIEKAFPNASVRLDYLGPA